MRNLLPALALSCGVAAAGDVSVRVAEERLVAEIRMDTGGAFCGQAALVDLQGAIRGQGEARATLSSAGVFAIPMDLPVAALSPAEQSELTWYRLRYAAGPCSETAVPVVVSMSEVLRDAFDIRVRGPEWTWATSYRFEIEASTPRREPAAGVEIEAELAGARAKGTTSPDGTVILAIPLAEGTYDSSPLRVTARYRGLVRVVEADTFSGWSTNALVSTDKSLYQPGQTLHVRAILLDASRRPIGRRPATVRIRGPEGVAVFRTNVITSAFGVASADWPVPADALTGTYQVSIARRDAPDTDPWSAAEVEVSHYELPTFTVAVKPDRPYALPGESSGVSVTATYLSGQPLPRFSVRIVRSRGWTYQRRDDEDEAELVAKGEAAPDGAFQAVVALPPLETRSWRKFEDTEFTAYVTDPTTARTERRRFTLRATAEPIHVYLVGQPKVHSSLAATLYVSTFGADGAPLPCDVTVKAGDALIGELRTNRYGAGKLVARIPKGEKVRLEARDAEGRRGTSEEELWRWRDAQEEDAGVRLVASKTLHRRGDPIDLTVETTFSEGRVLVDIARESGLLACTSIEIRRGRGHLTIPYRPEWSGPVTLAAYPDSARVGSSLWSIASYATVFFPDDRELLLSARTSRKIYRPGERGSARFTLRGTDGQPVAGALGVAIVDRSVEERARDYGSVQRYGTPGDPFTGPIRFLLDADEEFGGIRRTDLSRVAAHAAIPPELDLVAELMLNQWPSYAPRLASSSKTPSFEHLLDSSLVRLRNALRREGRRLPRTPEELDATLADERMERPRDPWDRPYRFLFERDGSFDVLRIVSAGPDGRFETGDDLLAANLRVSHFADEEAALARALHAFRARTAHHVADAVTLVAELKAAGTDPASWRDRDGGPVSVMVRRSWDFVVAELRSEEGVLLGSATVNFARELLASLQVALQDWARRTGRPAENEADFQRALEQAGIGVPVRDPFGVTWHTRFRVQPAVGSASVVEVGGRRFVRRRKGDEVSVELRSEGADRIADTADDEWEGAITLPRSTDESLVEAEEPARTTGAARAPSPSGRAALRGVVTDQNGASLPGVEVTCKETSWGDRRTAVTDSNGAYEFPTLADGTYEVVFTLSGFTKVVRTGIVVKDGRAAASVDATLSVSVAAEATVTGQAPVVETSASLSTMAAPGPGSSRPAGPPPTQTPRLRTYFPETLVWAPDLATAADGTARVRFRLADTITTWTLFAVGSSSDGRVGAARTDFTAFQPFFLELDPPRTLTVGDEIRLPVVVRNYQSRVQDVTLVLSSPPAVRPVEDAHRKISVPAGDSRSESFWLRADGAAHGVKVRVSASGDGEPRQAQPSDATEKVLDVRRNAEEHVVSRGLLVRGESTVAVDVPEGALAGSIRGRLTIYPGLSAQISESIEAVLKRPSGCAEQTTSSAYPSVLLLESLERSGGGRPELQARARGYILLALERLRSFRGGSGGFTYFGSGSEDAALTAYVASFLLDAERFVPVDETLLDGAIRWLVRGQDPDGSWSGERFGARKLVTTALAATALSRTRGRNPDALAATRKGLTYLRPFVAASAALGEPGEAQVLAAFTLLADSLDEPALADAAVARLAALARRAAGVVSWKSGSSSPYWGWGVAGDVETTALAARALLPRPSAHALADGAILFLLRSKDRDGIWFSGHATKEALAALLASAGRGATAGGEILVRAGGRELARVPLNPHSPDPISVDLAATVRAGRNEIVLTPSSDATAIALVTVRCDVPWPAPAASPDVAFGVSYDRTHARVGEEIVATAAARRTSENGGGMLLAEVGVPPGAEVDREALESLTSRYESGVRRYEVQPDRVIFYLWPRRDEPEIRFSLRFRVRYPIRAFSAPSTLVDYYNPDAHVALPPTRFFVE